jgi:hydrogenase expression/formation protein HypC
MCLAIPGKVKSVVALEGCMRMGKVEMGGIIKEINLHLVPDAKVDDYVLVHVGVAISIVDEEEARRSLLFLQQMNELDELYNSDKEMDPNEQDKKRDDIISNMTS